MEKSFAVTVIALQVASLGLMGRGEVVIVKGNELPASVKRYGARKICVT
jgi:hypothetical protein